MYPQLVYPVSHEPPQKAQGTRVSVLELLPQPGQPQFFVRQRMRRVDCALGRQPSNACLWACGLHSSLVFDSPFLERERVIEEKLVRPLQVSIVQGSPLAPESIVVGIRGWFGCSVCLVRA